MRSRNSRRYDKSEVRYIMRGGEDVPDGNFSWFALGDSAGEYSETGNKVHEALMIFAAAAS